MHTRSHPSNTHALVDTIHVHTAHAHAHHPHTLSNETHVSHITQNTQLHTRAHTSHTHTTHTPRTHHAHTTHHAHITHITHNTHIPHIANIHTPPTQREMNEQQQQQQQQYLAFEEEVKAIFDLSEPKKCPHWLIRCIDAAVAKSDGSAQMCFLRCVLKTLLKTMFYPAEEQLQSSDWCEEMHQHLQTTATHPTTNEALIVHFADLEDTWIILGVLQAYLKSVYERFGAKMFEQVIDPTNSAVSEFFNEEGGVHCMKNQFTFIFRDARVQALLLYHGRMRLLFGYEKNEYQEVYDAFSDAMQAYINDLVQNPCTFVSDTQALFGLLPFHNMCVQVQELIQQKGLLMWENGVHWLDAVKCGRMCTVHLY